MCREEADLIGDGREFQRRVLVKSGEIVPGRRAALGMQSERVNFRRKKLGSPAILRFFFKNRFFLLQYIQKQACYLVNILTVNRQEIYTTSSWDSLETVSTKNWHVYVQKSKWRSHLNCASPTVTCWLGFSSLAIYYRKRESASYIVREWLLWVGGSGLKKFHYPLVVQRERERAGERDACDIIDITLKWRVIMHMITSTARRPYLDLRVDACRVLEVHVKTRSLALERSIEQQGRVIDEWRWGSGSFAFAGQPAVDHPAAFRFMLQARRIDQVDVYFLFEWPWFYLWEQLG